MFSNLSSMGFDLQVCKHFGHMVQEYTVALAPNPNSLWFTGQRSKMGYVFVLST